MNKKQKQVMYAGILIIAVSFIIWLLFGGEFFTKSQVLVEKQDELFGTTIKEWEDQFIWGLDLSLAVSGVTFLISGILIFLFRLRKETINQNNIR